MDTRQEYNGTLVHAAALALALAVFLIDLTQPLGAAVGILYVLVIVLGLWSPWRPYPMVAAVAGIGFLGADTAIGWSDEVPGIIFINRPLMAIVLLAAAVLVSRFSRLERRLLAGVEQLADFKRALDQAAIVAITDVTGRITYVNDTFCEISKYRRDELIGQDHRIINSGYHPKSYIRSLWVTVANGRVWHGELRNRAKDGTIYWVDTTIVPFLNEEGKPYQYVAIRSDITARKAAEERLEQQAALAQVGQMAAVVAHEVRNPLAGIKGAIQVLMSRRPRDDGELPVMRDVVARIDALSGLINDLMVFARPRPIHPSTFDVRLVIEEAVNVLRRDPVAASVDVEIAGPTLALTADADLIRATVLNLLLNAAQAMNGKGRLRLTLGQADHRWALEIRDTGPGIPPGIRGQVFEPFFTTKSRGGGLGLPIARRTAELHGGTLTFDCPPEGGTAFTLTIPIRPAGRADAGQPAAASPGQTSRSGTAPGRG